MVHPKKTRSRRKRPSFLPPPPLPDFLQGMAGRIEIKQTLLVGYSRDQIGEWDTRKRRISILRSLSPGVKWYVLAHEFAHSAISDAGLSLPEDLEERICDAMAAAFAAAFEDLRRVDPAPTDGKAGTEE